MKKVIAALFAVVVGSTITVSTAMAGPAADSLGACLADNTSGKDRKEMARWVFVGMSTHPELEGFSKVTDKNRDDLDRVMAAIFTKLITESCPEQAKAAIGKEGPIAFQTAFGAIGKLAMQELMTNPEVGSSFTRYTKYLDQNKLNATLSNK